jgi:hypothetical protein
MLECSFDLNGKSMSAFKVGALSFPAFSGQGTHANKPGSACLVGLGPIPPGEYYIFDRQGGGRLEFFKNLFNDHSHWFALYAIDDQIDDKTFCDKAQRGSFRLHPKGPRGLSEGCITVENLADFHQIHSTLRATAMSPVPGTGLSAYGKVIVK